MDILITYQHVFIPLIGGLLLDALPGDPHRLPHPIRLFGTMIAFCDRTFNHGNNRKLKGIVVASVLVLLIFSVLYGLERILDRYPVAANIVNTILPGQT